MAFYRSTRVDMERTWDVYFKENPNRVMPRDAEVNRPGADAVVRALADQGEVRDPGRGAAPYIDERYLQDVLRGT